MNSKSGCPPCGVGYVMSDEHQEDSRRPPYRHGICDERQKDSMHSKFTIVTSVCRGQACRRQLIVDMQHRNFALFDW